MEVSYKKDLRHNYLVIAKSSNSNEEAYCVRMLQANSIKGILRPEPRIIDNQALLYYDISSKQSLEIIYAKTAIKYEQLNKLFLNLTKIIDQTYEYLLNENDLVLEPKHIFMELSSGEIYICYLPGYNKDIREQLVSLIEYMMNKVEYKDKEAVLYIYNLYSVCREEGFSYINLLLAIKGDKSDNPIKIEIKKSKDEENQKKEPEIALENQQPIKQIPVMMEKISDDQEQYYYPLKTYIYSGFCCLGLILILVISIKTKIIYTSFGGRIDYSKLVVLLLILLAVTGYLMKNIWDKKNRLTKIISKPIYINPIKEDIEADDNSISYIEPEQSIKDSDSLFPKKEDKEINPTVLLNAKMSSQGCYLDPEDKDILDVIQINNFPFVIGKQKGYVDYHLDREVVSRYHIKITREEGRYYITDLNSTNGTCLNKNPLPCYQRSEIKEGDEVTIAGIKYWFHECS